jgi:hypothetical protein
MTPESDQEAYESRDGHGKVLRLREDFGWRQFEGMKMDTVPLEKKG